MADYAVSLMKAVLEGLQGYNEDLMTLEPELSPSDWNDLSDAFEGIQEAMETLEWILRGMQTSEQAMKEDRP